MELYQKEHLLLEAGKGPESAEDFDRLLMATPNSSSLWVQYMVFFLHMAEVDKARGVAQRALATISFRCRKIHTSRVLPSYTPLSLSGKQRRS